MRLLINIYCLGGIYYEIPKINNVGTDRNLLNISKFVISKRIVNGLHMYVYYMDIHRCQLPEHNVFLINKLEH